MTSLTQLLWQKHIFLCKTSSVCWGWTFRARRQRLFSLITIQTCLVVFTFLFLLRLLTTNCRLWMFCCSAADTEAGEVKALQQQCLCPAQCRKWKEVELQRLVDRPKILQQLLRSNNNFFKGIMPKSAGFSFSSDNFRLFFIILDSKLQ